MGVRFLKSFVVSPSDRIAVIVSGTTRVPSLATLILALAINGQLFPANNSSAAQQFSENIQSSRSLAAFQMMPVGRIGQEPHLLFQCFLVYLAHGGQRNRLYEFDYLRDFVWSKILTGKSQNLSFQ